MAHLIKFVHARPDLKVHEDFRPKRAKDFIPDWYRKTSPLVKWDGVNESSNPLDLTVKKCVPLLDSLTAGYIIPLWNDCFIKQENNETHITLADNNNFLQTHGLVQNPHYPATGENGTFIKFVSPWSIVTPKGYSCLFVNPFHNPNGAVTILEAIVDTDSYHEVNFPALLNRPREQQVIPAGIPLVQVIPFKRDEWQIDYGDQSDIDKINNVSIRRHSVFINAYKKLFWSRKSYN